MAEVGEAGDRGESEEPSRSFNLPEWTVFFTILFLSYLFDECTTFIVFGPFRLQSSFERFFL